MISILLLAVLFSPLLNAQIIERNYNNHFTLWVDCKEKTAIRFEYLLTKDTGNAKRPSGYKVDDPQIPNRCEQKITRSYRNGYDRGHLVASNHMDINYQAIRDANYMANILPQASGMNQGAWLRTEEIHECYRDIVNVRAIGGPYFGKGTKSQFLGTHGVRTPSHYWKVLIKEEDEKQIDALAWLIPNSDGSTYWELDNYLVSVEQLGGMVGEIGVDRNLMKMKQSRSWVIPRGCDKG